MGFRLGFSSSLGFGKKSCYIYISRFSWAKPSRHHRLHQEPWTSKAWTKRYCFATALWGADAGYALGALGLGQRLKELSPNIERVMLHTDDVPSNYLEVELRG
jgi:hypothetical protein